MSDSQYAITDFDLSMPDDILKTEVLNQIFGNSPVYSIRKNLLNVFCTKLQVKKVSYVNEEGNDDIDIEEFISESFDEFYNMVTKQLKETCGLLIDVTGGGFNQNSINYIYEMFIVRLHETIIEYITQYIILNKNKFGEMFNDDESANMAVRIARRSYKSKADVAIAIHYSEIIDTIFNDEQSLNPEVIVNVLYKYNPEDYIYMLIHNLFGVSYLTFDISRFQNFIKTRYMDPVTLANTKVSVIERLIPTFKPREPNDE